MNKCYFCGGTTEIKNVTVDFRWGNQLFIVENVPVEVCTQCGERYYSAKVSHKLDEIVKKSNSKSQKPKRTVEIPVFSWQ